LRLCHWVADYYCCSLGQVVRQFINGSIKKPVRAQKIPEKKKFDANGNRELKLTGEQRNAADRLQIFLKGNNHQVALLHGITGSGKTIVYLELIKEARKQGKSVLVLVPEIGLARPIREFIERHLAEPVALLHSKMSATERFKNWMLVREGTCQITVGARSAVWAPFSNLGLIIVDEEHDGSYKQSEGIPRYHARDVAIYRGYLTRSLVLLGSATPSLESYNNAVQGKYMLLELRERYGDAVLPTVQVIDMKAEHAAGNWGPYSILLQEAIRERLEKKEQVILLLNRRGFAPVLLCRTCGYISRCPACDITTTYHAVGNKLSCHYCGYREPAPDQCPSCGGIKIKYQGVGIQKAEKLLCELFPDARIMRMDTDTTRRRMAHETMLSDFSQQKTDILIGTQMVAKGLDFPNVTLVGIISADTGLNIPDFRASETTFQLLAQVAGRAGRGVKTGTVIMQTYAPEEQSIVCAQKHDYNTFYTIERNNRKQLNYPPQQRLTQIILSDRNQKTLLQSAQELVRLLKKTSEGVLTVLGPAPAPVAKQNNKYRMLVLLKGASARKMHQHVSRALREFQGKKVQTIVDVDPYNML
jgi:primosomal protein N' (replication factor Y)